MTNHLPQLFSDGLSTRSGIFWHPHLSFVKNYEQISRIVGETRVQWVIIFYQMSILCGTNGLSLLFAVSLGKY